MDAAMAVCDQKDLIGGLHEGNYQKRKKDAMQNSKQCKNHINHIQIMIPDIVQLFQFSM